MAGIKSKGTVALRMKLRSANASQYSIRLIDDSGQTHQRGGLPIDTDNQWHEVVIDPAKIAGGEHWGGAYDGKWHGSIRLIELMLNTSSSSDKAPILEFGDIRMDVIVEAEPSSMQTEAITPIRNGMSREPSNRLPIRKLTQPPCNSNAPSTNGILRR